MSDLEPSTEAERLARIEKSLLSIAASLTTLRKTGKSDATHITKWEQLDALPVGSIVIDPFDENENAPVVACKTARGDWQIMGDDPERRWSPQSIVECARQSLRVIHQPSTEDAKP